MRVNDGTRTPVEGQAQRAAGLIDRFAIWVARHWLAFFNVLVALFIALPFLAPVLMETGAKRVGEIIYAIYSPTCHQLPERSFFLGGPQRVYTVAELEATGEIPAGQNQVQREFLRWPGSAETGYKVAVCERDIGIYGSILLAGLAFGGVRRRWTTKGRMVPRMPAILYLLFVLPILLDGGTQLFGLRESTWELRLITGAIFGVGTVALAYPYVQAAMDDVIRTAKTPASNTAPKTGQDQQPGV
jgi:uncharacterized membrane protein